MSITLSDGTVTLSLNPDLAWADEFAWNPVEQTVERTLSGGLIVSVAARVKGRPITLQSFDESSGWVTKGDIETIRTFAATPGKTMTLTIGAAARTVVFRHEEGAAIEAIPVVFYSDAASEDWYRVVLRFLEV